MVYFDEKWKSLCVVLEAENSRKADYMVKDLRRALFDLYLSADLSAVDGEKAKKTVAFASRLMPLEYMYSNDYGVIVVVLPGSGNDPRKDWNDLLQGVFECAKAPRTDGGEINLFPLFPLLQAITPEVGEVGTLGPTVEEWQAKHAIKYV